MKIGRHPSERDDVSTGGFTSRPQLPQTQMRRLLAAAASDPYGLVIRLLPAWAMSPEAVEEAVRVLRVTTKQLRRRRQPLKTLLTALDLVSRSAQLRPTVLKMFELAAAARPPRNRSDRAALRARLPEVAKRYTRLRRMGNRLVGLCPLHHDTRPSFTVYPNGTFFCFGCQMWGDAADLVSRVEGIAIGEAIRQLLPHRGAP